MVDGVRWVLFDAVGTLIYADPPVAEVYQAAGRKFGSRLEASEIQQRFRIAWAAEAEAGSSLTRPATSEFAELARWRQIVAAVFGDVPPESAGRLFQSLWLHFACPQSWRLYGDVEPALRGLRQRDCRLGIASNFDGRLLKIVQSLSGLAACERVFVSSQL